MKETGHPKFYFFDPGVVRAITRRLREPLESIERGTLLETWVLHELRAHLAYSESGGTLAYWRTPSGTEVDFISTRGKRSIGIEVKATPRWRGEHGRALKELARAGVVERCIAVYTGDRALRDEEVRALPVAQSLRELSEGHVVG